MAVMTTSISASSPPPFSPIPANSKHRNNPNKIPPFSTSIKTQNPSLQKSPKSPKISPKNPRKTAPKRDKSTYPWSFPLQKKNPHSIYKDIQRFARRNQLKEALTILDYLEQQGIPVNASTFSAVIAACIRSKSKTEAKQIHAHIRINGVENNEFLKPKIVQMYVSCGLADDAKRVFGDDENEESNSVYSWNALLRGNVVVGGKKYKDLLYTFARMRETGVEFNVYSFSCLIKSFGGAAAFRQGLKIHGLLIKNGFIGSEMLKTSLIDMYFKCGRVKLAYHLFDEMSERDVVLWGAMIAGFAHNKLPREVIRYARWMIKEGVLPNSVVLTSMLPILGELGAWKMGKEVHAFVIKRRNYMEQPFLKSALIDMYCKCGDMTYGRRVFYNSGDRTTVSWTALISGYISNGKLDQAIRSIIWMQQEGFKPDVVSLATILPVCAKLKALRQGKEIHGFLLKNGFLPNVSLITSLIVMYSKCGVLEISRRLFNGMEARNVIAWTAYMVSCIENEHPVEALDVFRSMQQSKHRADSVTMARILELCHELRLLKLGKELHGQVLKKGIEYVPWVLARLVKLYGKCGMIEKAKLLFDLYPCDGVVAPTAMMLAYGYNNCFREALALFNEMLIEGKPPNTDTLDVVLAICDQAGFADDAGKIFQLMTRKYRIRPSKEQYAVMAGLLTRSGQLQEAERYIQWGSKLDS
ncbi:pentatricopeptide repeat-containing protein At1g71460, chloroplastic-like [Chenopodium quinoa]|uniref:pentatricopeptide repeat-containing protein At1g71460, chloroplastic-like n=1 Tax=Chenopodium quinoa TaxID=63459 RepID=UPI000B79A7D5|nr:pentatricopeptide repeat-containing protein At1g71460, chloroplastic-like [Chenopodium quinoa]